MRVLVVDDEPGIRTTVTAALRRLECEAMAAGSSDEARRIVAAQEFDLCLLDVRLGTASGLDLLTELLGERPGMAIVIMTAFASYDIAVEAVKRGADDFLPKPFTPGQIGHVLARVRQRRQERWQREQLGRELQAAVPEADLTTRSRSLQAVLETIARAAGSDASVLLRGESGTGKGVLARHLHDLSPRRGRPFLVVNCPTLSEDLLASELFGHVKGAFTGASSDQLGKVEAAEGGTLFLDEVTEIAPPLQAKLLRFIQERQFERVGDTRSRRSDVRVVAATNRDVEAAVADGQFREDLLYRLNVIEVTVPPLRERREDTLPLARRFLEFFAAHTGHHRQGLSPAAERLLESYAWPGNVRELRNAIERAVILWPARVIEPQAFPEKMLAQAEEPPSLGGNVTLEELERLHILAVLARTPTQEEAARILGIDPSTLWRKRRKYEWAE